MDKGIIKIKDKGPLKRGCTVLISDYLKALLESWDKTESHNYLVRRTWSLSRRCLYIKKKTGIHVTPSIFRKTFASLCAENDAPMIKLSKSLGHASTATTSKYYTDVRYSEFEIISKLSPKY